MYQAKNGGRNGVVVAVEGGAEPAAPTADELSAALHTGELVFWLQPEVGRRGEVSGAFATLRWQRSHGHVADAGDFAALAERCGLMPEIEALVLERCAHLLAQWRRMPARAGHRLSLAPSPHQLREPGFGRRVLDALAAHDCPADGLALELAAFALEGEAARANIALLRRAGVCVIIAEFGLDTASLAGLRRLEADGLRIARELVRTCASSAVEGAAVRAILGLARELGLFVVAAGVENPAQASLLSEAGCERLRGDLYGLGESDSTHTCGELRGAARHPGCQA